MNAAEIPFYVGTYTKAGGSQGIYRLTLDHETGKLSEPVLAAESKSAKPPVDTEWKRDVFESVYREGQFAHLIDLPDPQSGIDFGARLFADPTMEYFRVFEVMRDYGMYERTEAPQYYPPVERR